MFLPYPMQPSPKESENRKMSSTFLLLCHSLQFPLLLSLREETQTKKNTV